MATHYATKLLPLSSQTKLTLIVILIVTVLNCNIYAHFIDTHKKVFPVYKSDLSRRCVLRLVGAAIILLHYLFADLAEAYSA